MSDGLNTCERCVREIVATLDGMQCTTATVWQRSRFAEARSVWCNIHVLSGAGDAPFPYDGAEGVHACEILLGAPPISCTALPVRGGVCFEFFLCLPIAL